MSIVEVKETKSPAWQKWLTAAETGEWPDPEAERLAGEEQARAVERLAAEEQARAAEEQVRAAKARAAKQRRKQQRAKDDLSPELRQQRIDAIIAELDVPAMTIEERRLAAIRLHEADATFQQIGDVFGVRRQRAFQMINEDGKPRERQRPHIRVNKAALSSVHLRVIKTGQNWAICGFANYHDVGPYKTRQEADEMLALLREADALFSSPDTDDLDNLAMVLKLKNAGFKTNAEIAAIFRKQSTWITFILKLNELPDNLLQYLRDGEVTATTLIKATHRYGTVATREAIQTLLAEQPGKVPLREIEEYIRRKKRRA